MVECESLDGFKPYDTPGVLDTIGASKHSGQAGAYASITISGMYPAACVAQRQDFIRSPC